MNHCEAIVALFSHEYALSSIQENNAELNATYTLESMFVPNEQDIIRVLDLLPKRDTCSISIDIGSQSPVSMDIDNHSSFLSELNIKLEIKEPSDKILFNLKISKSKLDQTISVYRIEKLLEFWKANGVLSAFKKYESFSQDIRHAQLLNSDLEFHVGRVKFSQNHSPDIASFQDDDRINIIDKRNNVSHFSNEYNLGFIPDDFKTSETAPTNISTFFRQLRFLGALAFICDTSRFEEGSISLRLNGYRSYFANFPDNFSFTPPITDELYNVYKWVYCEGSVIDKIGIARNILSLHLDPETSFLTIHKGVLSSIESGFQIYLKENVQQYIEVKNKISEFIQQASDKAHGISSNFGSAYKTSIFSLYSFFASAFLIQILDKDRTIIIGDKLLVIFVAFICISIFMMRESKKETNIELEKFREDYRQLKSRYQDLLTPLDITRILDDDKQHTSDINYVNRRLNSYSRLWKGSLFVMFVLILALWLFDKPVIIETVLQFATALICK